MGDSLELISVAIMVDEPFRHVLLIDYLRDIENELLLEEVSLFPALDAVLGECVESQLDAHLLGQAGQGHHVYLSLRPERQLNELVVHDECLVYPVAVQVRVVVLLDYLYLGGRVLAAAQSGDLREEMSSIPSAFSTFW